MTTVESWNRALASAVSKDAATDLLNADRDIYVTSWDRYTSLSTHHQYFKLSKDPFPRKQWVLFIKSCRNRMCVSQLGANCLHYFSRSQLPWQTQHRMCAFPLTITPENTVHSRTQVGFILFCFCHCLKKKKLIEMHSHTWMDSYFSFCVTWTLIFSA